MIIQDLIFAIGSLFFIASLLPMALNKNAKVSRWTSISTGIVLTIFAVTQYTLGLTLAAITSMISSLEWLFIGWKRA